MLFPQDEICNWLCEEMTSEEIDVSQVDMAGNTPLHLAAREGRLLTISTLLQHGAKVHLKVGGTAAASSVHSFGQCKIAIRWNNG